MKANKLLPLLMLATMGLAACGPTGGNTGGNGGTGNGGDNTPDKLPEKLNAPVTLTVWATEKEEEVLNTVVDAYNAKNPDAKITLKYTPVSEADCATAVLKDPNSEEAPDLFNIADDQLFKLVSNEAAFKIGGMYEKNIKASNSAASLAGAMYKDELYGLPITNDNGFFMWYDKGMINDEATLGNLEALLKLAKDNNKQILLDVPNSWYAPTFVMAPQACGTNSISWKADENKKVSYDVNWDNEIGVKVCEYIGDLLAPYYADKTLIVGSNGEIKNGFTDGKLMAAVSGSWMEKDIEAILHDNTGAAKLPSYHIDGKAYQMATFTGAKVYVVNNYKSAEQKAAAVFLASLLTNKENQLLRFEKRNASPCNIEAMADPRFTENISAGGLALAQQVAAAAAVQSTSVQDRYFADGALGNAMGTAYKTGDLGDYANWAEFLKAKCDDLRTAM